MKIYRQPIKRQLFLRKPDRTSAGFSGSAHIFMLSALLLIFVAGGSYLYSVNQTAVQGYNIRALEKEIDKLKQENAELKITEADLRSLYRIETSAEALTMQKPENVIYLEGRGAVALK